MVSSVEEARLLELVNEYLGTKTEWIREIMSEQDIGISVADLFNDLLSGKFNQGKVKGINAQLEIKLANGKYSVVTKENTKMSNGMKGKLLQLLSAELNKNPEINATAIKRAENLLR